MTEAQRNLLLNLKARQEAGEHLPCPRCGRDSMDPVLYHNSLSRHADIMICTGCGMHEAFLDMEARVKPLDDWACMKTT